MMIPALTDEYTTSGSAGGSAIHTHYGYHAIIFHIYFECVSVPAYIYIFSIQKEQISY